MSAEKQAKEPKEPKAPKGPKEPKAPREGKAPKDKEKGKSKGKPAEIEKAAGPPRLKQRYREVVREGLKQRFGISNDMAVPRLKKIVVNMGVRGAVENKAKVDSAARDLGTISGQRPTIRLAKKAISGFKLRAGMPIGCAVTLRGDRMWEFADRLISVALPRIRDFRGVKGKLDGRGNFSLGVAEQTIFPEIDFDKMEFQQGMDITFVTTAKDDEQGLALLKGLGMPFRDEG